MMMRIWVAVIVLIAGRGACAQNELTSEETKAGWILLFDGKTMNGWEDPRLKNPAGTSWTIEDNCLKADPRPGINEDLFTKSLYNDFELAFEWKISKAGNSGVKYRIQKHLFIPPPEPGKPERFEARVERAFSMPPIERPAKGQDYVIGFEYQLTDDATNGDALHNVKHTAGALYDMVAPSQRAARPVGEWNSSRIVVRGKHVEHWMNGVKVVDSSLDSPAALEGIRKRWAAAPHVVDLLTTQPVTECPVSLQNHGDAAWFRAIKIRPLH